MPLRFLLPPSTPAVRGSQVNRVLQSGRDMGMAVCRSWAFYDGSGWNSLQTGPGQFNEDTFKVSGFQAHEDTFKVSGFQAPEDTFKEC